jgi:hypothetical protein
LRPMPRAAHRCSMKSTGSRFGSAISLEP